MTFWLPRTFPLQKQMHIRSFRSKAQITSSSVRKQFKDYFVNDHMHTFIPSSPIRPLFDPTVPFVNAGMNQFKSILQGHTEPPWTRVTNYQKCARVGGKHNDLDLVGLDGYHHTFFEMLGNWSFGDYSKKEACKMAWELLLGTFRLDPNQLYVTYFGGDDGLGIAADMECREIWMELGVKKHHILPFGSKDNFWEMGLSGPCGPCTEIHVDHVPGRSSAQDRVNAGFSDLTELWNIVFIQYNRNIDDTLTHLSRHHIDTGMGFERLVAVLNGCSSNYDTDVFRPLMDFICKRANIPRYCSSFNETDETFSRDYMYRVISDHSRLLTVALADGMVPNHQYKLRWVLRKSLRILSTYLNVDQSFLIELTNHVAESLSDVYPEIGKNLPKVQALIGSEADIFNSLLSSLPPKWRRLVNEEPKLDHVLLMGSNANAIISSYEKMKAVNGPKLPPSLSALLHDSHGMGPVMIEELCNIVGLKFDEDAHAQEIEKFKKKSKLATAEGPHLSNLAKNLMSAGIPSTHDSQKYNFVKSSEGYIFPHVNARVLALIEDGAVRQKLNGTVECGVVLDQTNFYHTAGGQVHDTGFIAHESLKENFFEVKNVRNDGGYIVHFGTLNGCLNVDDNVELKINVDDRLGCMRNHTLAHLINGEIHKQFEAPVQEGCLVGPQFLKLTYNLHGREILVHDVETIEEKVRETVQDRMPVERYTVNCWGIPPDTIFLPDKTYPIENIHIVDVIRNDVVLAREPCCGTHLDNTGDCGAVCITEVMKHSPGKSSVCAVSGSLAEESLRNGQKIIDEVERLSSSVQVFLNQKELKNIIAQSEQPSQNVPHSKAMVKQLLKLFKLHSHISASERNLSRRLPYTVFVKAEASLNSIFRTLDRVARTLSEKEVEDAAKDAYFLVYNVQSLSYLDSVLLNKITRKIKVPIMLFCAKRDGEVKVRCCVPSGVVSSTFNAELWINEVKEYFTLPEKQKPFYYNIPPTKEEKRSNPALVCTLPSLKTHPRQTKYLIKDAMDAATAFAQNNLPIIK